MDKFLTTFLLLCALPIPVIANPIEKILAASEQVSMTKLEAVKINNPIRPFSTDGCSGGMTQGWKLFSQIIPGFKHKYGEAPPWEECCIEHDKAYWLGETDNGYAKRKLADQQLQTCIVTYGLQHNSELSSKWKVSEHVVEDSFTLLAKAVYQAVRIGGQPCTTFPWRWGYGWPDCTTFSSE